MARRIVLGVLIATALVLAALGYRTAGASTATGSTNVAPGAPVLSAGRLPGVLASAASDALVRATATNTAASARLGSGASSSCVVIAQGNRTAFASNSDAPLIPASSLKLVTASALLEAFGPTATFSTAVKTEGDPKNGVVAGPLYVVGGGDPLLFTTDYAATVKLDPDVHTSLETLADRVASSGIRSVTGDVVADESRFDSQRYVPSWDPSYITSGQIGPASALQVNQGFASFSAGRVVAQDPALQSATVFRNLLLARGIAVTGGVSKATAPAKAHDIATIDSAPVSSIVGEMLRTSDNTVAEMMTKNLGVKKKEEGTTNAGVTAAHEHLVQADPSASGVSAVDGSGLDRTDRATCNAIDHVLNSDGSAGVIATGMAKAGETGTLKDRMTNSAAVGKVVAKTGTLSNVSALAGWVTPAGQQPYSFAVITNGVATETGRRFEDQLAVALAALPKPPAVDDYASVPAGP